MELQGKIILALPERSGVSARGKLMKHILVKWFSRSLVQIVYSALISK